MCFGVEDPTGIRIEEESEGGECSHLLEGPREEIVEGVGLLIVYGHGEGSNVVCNVWMSSEGAENGEAVGGGGDWDVLVERAEGDGVEGVVDTCKSNEIVDGEEAADGVQ